ncbi:hypothetical protein L1987_38830 [Smallanthus sonchifolius]|uniref:Uncharacterized protein n=1 Tax=Smallanthus sonchifolius TaxID=185202 RepID=A0ACB9HLM7_9ASTR|nr:hypothetical protein L1987_38830 [Smallanthus sonchifolius]
MKFILKHGKGEKDIQNLRQEIEGDLFEVIEDDKCLPEDVVQKIAKQLALHCTWPQNLYNSNPTTTLLICGPLGSFCMNHLLPLKNRQCRDQDVLSANQSLNILSNLVADGAINSTGVLDEFFWELIGYTDNFLSPKKSDSNDLLCFSVIKKLLDNCGGGFGDSYIRHWVPMVELYKEVSSSTEDASGGLLYESIACITVIVSRAAQGLKASLVSNRADMAINGLKEILDHAKSSGLVDTLLSHLVTCGQV